MAYDIVLTTSQMTTQTLTKNLATINASLNKTRYLSAASGEDYIGYSVNITDGVLDMGGDPSFRYWAFILIFFPLCTIFGNVLVVLSVFREKYLQTCTNFFVVSLALSDLVVASLVMPFAVYYEITQKWYMSNFLCDAWVATDVMGSTASILNLVSIAIDRYIAVQYPLKYAQHKNSNRIYLTIAFVWILSIIIALPMVLGMNETDTRNPDECAFNNGTFLIYSSIFSFYLPTVIMIILYYKIFRKIRKRAKNQNAVKYSLVKDKKRNSATSNKINNLEKQVTIRSETTEKQPLKEITNVESPTKENAQQIESAKQIPQVSKKHSPILNTKSIKKNLNNAVQKISNSTSIASKKEKKVTKTLAIVLIVYLFCWSPFFAVNNLTVAFCKKMNYECKFITNELISLLTWLGYLNSLLNPIIYTTYNIEFRRAFAKILSDICEICRTN